MTMMQSLIDRSVKQDNTIAQLGMAITEIKQSKDVDTGASSSGPSGGFPGQAGAGASPKLAKPVGEPTSPTPAITPTPVAATPQASPMETTPPPHRRYGSPSPPNAQKDPPTPVDEAAEAAAAAAASHPTPNIKEESQDYTQIPCPKVFHPISPTQPMAPGDPVCEDPLMAPPTRSFTEPIDVLDSQTMSASQIIEAISKIDSAHDKPVDATTEAAATSDAVPSPPRKVARETSRPKEGGA